MGDLLDRVRQIREQEGLGLAEALAKAKKQIAKEAAARNKALLDAMDAGLGIVEAQKKVDEQMGTRR